jgi:TRAP-type C4-dicarboxylate transport system permease small subunit
MVTLQWPADILIAMLHKRALESVEWLADTVMLQCCAVMLIILLC